MYYGQSSLWQHSKPYRVLVYVTAVLALLVVYGFIKHALLTRQSLPNNISNMTQAHVLQTATNSTPQSTAVPAYAVVNAPNPSPSATLDNLPNAQNTWSSTLNPNGIVPARGFDVYYINTTDPKTVVYKDNVQKIAINYAYNQFHNIPSEKFGAYWVGKLVVPNDALYQVEASLSWSSARILIDGKVIAEGTNSLKQTSFYLPKGEHTLEVEYTNAWHTTSFAAHVLPAITTYSSAGLKQALGQLNLPSATKLYVGAVYESQSIDNSINVSVARSSDPFVLYLSSYAAVDWQVYGATPLAIIYNGSTGSRVSAVGNPPVFRTDEAIYYDVFNMDSTKESCYCTAGRFHCSNEQHYLPQAMDGVKKATGLDLSGGTGIYGTSTMTVPNIYITKDVLNEQANMLAQIQQQRQACVTTNPATLMN